MATNIIVHGGAGPWLAGSARFDQAVEACKRAASAGQKVLLSGEPALRAVEEAVRVLEDDPALDAGRGSVPNLEGQIEMDALIMDGSTLDLGAVAAVQLIRNPITLARLVMTKCDYNFLVGRGAEAFAESMGIARCELEDLIYQWNEPILNRPEHQKDGNGQALYPGSDTVGAVAMDDAGNLAAATSTGGLRNKIPGRVGDSPLVGSGAYADNSTAAVSATGEGESLMKIVISKQVCDFVAGGLSAQQACNSAIKMLKDRVDGQGGLIAVDHERRIGFAFNTRAMPHAYADENQAIVAGHKSRDHN
jgi:beta-aspartyl-peptidase (threonine type)